MRNDVINRKAEDEIDLRQQFQDIRSKWHYFLLSFFFFAAASLLYIKFTQPVYEARSSVLIKDTRNTSNNIEDILSGDILGNVKNVATEMGILHSRSVLEETISELPLRASVYSGNGFFSSPLYKTAPFAISIQQVHEGVYDEIFQLSPIDSGRFSLSVDADNHLLDGYHYESTHRFGEPISTPYFSITIARKDGAKIEGEYSFTLNSTNKLISYYEEHLQVEPINKDATIVAMTVRDKIPERAVDFLNMLGRVYINRDVKDKSSVAALTLKFVDEQLEEISKTLNKTELELQRFKEERGTVDLSEESKAYLERVTAVDESRLKEELDLRTLDYLYDYVSNGKDAESLAPASMGNPDPLLINLITRLKELQSKRKSLVFGGSKKSPAVRVIDEQIEQTRKDLIENINSLRNIATTNLQGIRKQLNEYESAIRQIPNIERELLSIQRNFSVNENIYLYLLQKKAETGIAKATAVSDNKILDKASLNEKPVVPNKRAVFIVALTLALFLPMAFIILQGYMKTTISNKQDVEKLSKIPIIGVVGHQSTGERLVVASRPKSSIAEAFRSIRANLMFFGLANDHKIVLITSSVGGEGKSFSTLNLATVLSLQHHKVIIVGMDLRKPQLTKELGVENSDGVSTLLIGKASLDSVIQQSNVSGIDIIPSGPVPPNPAELLTKPEVVQLLDELKNRYDYIIIDTPPVGIVSDAMMLMNHADVNIFVLRENYSKKEYIKTINEYYSQGKVKNLCILLNDAGNSQRYGYGYGYNYGYHGYGYYDEEHRKKGFFHRIFRKKS